MDGEDETHCLRYPGMNHTIGFLPPRDAGLLCFYYLTGEAPKQTSTTEAQRQ